MAELPSLPDNMEQLLQYNCASHDCQQRMSELRVYKASTNMDMKHMRGAIGQVCTKCFKTVFHTNSYGQNDFSIAQALIESFYEKTGLPRGPPLPTRARKSPTYLSNGRPSSFQGPPPSQPVFTPAQAHLQSQAPPTLGFPPPSQQSAGQPTSHSPEKPGTQCPRCFARGRRSRGNDSCMEGLCQSCCLARVAEAQNSGVYRRLCPIGKHKPAPPSTLPPSSSYPTPAPTPAPAPFYAPAGNFDVSQNAAGSYPAPTHTPAVPSQQYEHSQPSQQRTQLSAPTAPAPPRAKPLSVPLDRAWRTAHENAREGVDIEKSLKSRQQEMADIERRTIPMVLYFKAGVAALETSWIILDTFPKCQLKDHVALMRDLKLDLTSIIDVYHGAGSGWLGCSPDTVLTLASGRPLILRVRSSLTEPLELEDCPNIATHIDRYNAHNRGNLKRHGQEMTAPLSKALRLSDEEPLSSATSAIVTPTPTTPSPLQPVLRRTPAPHPMHSPVTQRLVSPPLRDENALAPRRYTGTQKKFKGVKVFVMQPLVRTGKGGVASFPRDFAYCDVRYGLEVELKHLQLEGLLEKEVFSLVFSGATYVKSTVGDHRRKLDTAPQELRDKFERLGHTAQGSYSFFIIALRKLQSKKKSGNGGGDSGDDTDSDTKDVGDLDKGVVEEGLDSDGDLFGDDGKTLNWNKVAPSGLCPFCDCPLPDSPSDTLTAHLIPLLKISKRDPLPDNPQHRKLSIREHASFCQKHRHESTEVTKAIDNAWPLQIDFNKLPQRIRDLREELEMIMEDPDNSTFFTLSKESFGPGMSGSARIFQTFAKQGAAYYGERGFEVLLNTLREMFPQKDLPMDDFKPLDYLAVIDEFLLPEVAVMLIMQDRGVSNDVAKRIHRESRVFGALQHPIDDVSTVKKEPVEVPLTSIKSTTSGDNIVIDLTTDD